MFGYLSADLFSLSPYPLVFSGGGARAVPVEQRTTCDCRGAVDAVPEPPAARHLRPPERTVDAALEHDGGGAGAQRAEDVQRARCRGFRQVK